MTSREDILGLTANQILKIINDLELKVSPDRCDKCKNKYSQEGIKCVIFCNENKDPSRYDRDRNRYVEAKK